MTIDEFARQVGQGVRFIQSRSTKDMVALLGDCEGFGTTPERAVHNLVETLKKKKAVQAGWNVYSVPEDLSVPQEPIPASKLDYGERDLNAKILELESKLAQIMGDGHNAMVC